MRQFSLRLDVINPKTLPEPRTLLSWLSDAARARRSLDCRECADTVEESWPSITRRFTPQVSHLVGYEFYGDSLSGEPARGHGRKFIAGSVLYVSG